MKYFYKIYGEKYIAFQNLSDIQRLTSNSLNSLRSFSWSSLHEITLGIHIVYDLSLDEVNRKLYLSE